ncbi:TrkA C-terminal domain-containing protein [Treponema sp.]|nr:TrkA C-terminal domain-containing protein [Treponema sp.]MBR4323615.1 hypothetical protein [Treponema sp.]
MSHLRGDSVTGIHSVNGGSLEIAEIIVPEESEVEGKALKDIAENGKFLVLQVQKHGEESYSVPGGNTVLDAGDKIILIINASENETVMKKFGTEL